MPLSIPVPLALGRLKQLPQRTNEVWQGGIVRLPAWVAHPTDPEGPPSRPTGAFWVSLRTGLVHVAFPAAGHAASPELALSALIEFGLKRAKHLEGRPARIEVSDPALRDALAEPLASISTVITVVDDLPAVREVLHQMEAETTGRRFPGLLESPGVTIDRVRAFAQAAAAFFTARPWLHLANEDLIIVDGNGLPRTMRHLCVLGWGGEQFGIGFFDSRAAFQRVLDQADVRLTRRAHGITFGPIDELPFGDVDAWMDHDLPVAGERAYPLAADLHRGGEMRRPDARELTCGEALLRALAETTEDEMDAGRWQKRVATFDGPIDLTLTMPSLIEDDEGLHTSAGRLKTMSRVAERASVRIQQMTEGRSFESLDDLNAEIDRAEQRGLFDAPAEQAAGRELTALERAQELAYDAMEAEGRMRIKRARQALAMSPDCADAWVILAQTASTPSIACERYERGVEAGLRAIGTARFEELTGEFWGHLDTRPYMRARLGLAQTLQDLGRNDEALTHYRELLRLNPNDNQGVRYLLVSALLELHRDAEIGSLFDDYGDDPQAIWSYAQALWRFRTEGDTARARSALDKARRANPHVITYLIKPESAPVLRSPYFSLGSKDEAAYVADELGAAFDATPGAIAWLRSQMRKRKTRN